MSKFTNEVLIVRTTIISRTRISLPSRYHRLFQSSVLPEGVTVIRFPVNDHELSADLTQFQQDFPLVKVDISSNAIEEY